MTDVALLGGAGGKAYQRACEHKEYLKHLWFQHDSLPVTCPSSLVRTARSTGYYTRYCFWLLNEAVPSSPPNPMVSTAEDGTMTIDPFSLIAS